MQEGLWDQEVMCKSIKVSVCFYTEEVKVLEGHFKDRPGGERSLPCRWSLIDSTPIGVQKDSLNKKNDP